MICKCFQILCLSLLLNFQQLLVYIFVLIHLQGILFHTLVLTLLYYLVLTVKLMSVSPSILAILYTGWLGSFVEL